MCESYLGQSGEAMIPQYEDDTGLSKAQVFQASMATGRSRNVRLNYKPDD